MSVRNVIPHDPVHAYLCAVPWCPKYVRAASRPSQPDGLPHGFAWVVEPDEGPLGWLTAMPAETSGNRCRLIGPGHRSCGQPAVAWLRRGRYYWAYCGGHLYGRWIEDGRVVGWRLRQAQS